MASGGFWKPGAPAPDQVDRESEQESNFVVWNPNAWRTIQQQRQILPIFNHKYQILYLLENYQVVIIVGTTGSGKTTQIPQYLDENGWTQGGRIVGCTQPRRVAASSVAARVAQELNCEVGDAVGYSVRFDEKFDPEKTRIKYMTDGMLIREMMSDPLLTRYSVIMLDEAHERTLSTDILVGLIRKVMRKRLDLRVIVSSATVDAKEFFEFFNIRGQNPVNHSLQDSAAILSIPGRLYPVDIFYTERPAAHYFNAIVETILEIHRKEQEGDILVFLTGQEEIDDMVRQLNERAVSDSGAVKLMPLPMYSGLPDSQQLLVFRKTPINTRKVVIATNIAETSITIDGIVFVVDCGFVKIRTYNPQSGMEALVIVPASQSSANQRAGRAGRVRPGKCFRMYTEEAFYSVMKDKTPPEMLRSNLSSMLLQLKAMGIDNVMQFDFMTSPPSTSMIRALELLYALGALDADAKLTRPLGEQMAEFPIDPQLAKLLIASGQFGCSEEILTIASMVQVQFVFFTPKGMQAKVDAMRARFSVYEGDHLTLLNVYNSFLRNKQDSKWCQAHFINFKAMKRVIEIRKQLKKYAAKFHVPMSSSSDVDTIRKCLVAGYFANAARLQPDGSYKTVRSSHRLAIHPNSVCFKFPPEWVIFHEVVLTTKEFMREVTAIEPQWLPEVAPHFYQTKLASVPTQQDAPAMPVAPQATPSGILHYSPF